MATPRPLWLGLTVALAAAVLGWFLWRPKAHDPAAAGASSPSGGAARTNAAPAIAATDETVEAVTLAAPDAAPPAEGQRTQVEWGEHGLGRGTSEDGYPGGPNAFLTGPDGSTWVLDQFHQRMVRLGPDGKVLESRPLHVKSPADVALGQDGTMAVIDRSKDHKVELFDKDGRSRGTLPLPEPEPGSPSELTRVFVDKDKVYAQKGEGGPLVPLGGVDGRAALGEETNGQFSRDGTLLIAAGITNYEDGRVWVSGADPKSSANLFTRAVTLGNPIEQVLLLDSDLTGMIYFVLKAVWGDEGGASTVVLCVDGTQRGKVTRIFSLPYPDEPLDTFRKFDVAPEGGLLAAEYTETGAAYRMHSCR